MRRRDFIAAIGGTAAWPIAARAQRRGIPVIGFLNGSARTYEPGLAALREGLGQQGYVEGRNIEILYRFADAHYDRLPAMAADLVSRRVAVIVASGGAPPAAKAATATIPIVFVSGQDPVEVGLVASLNRPGGNATGVSILSVELTAKRLELLHEFVPAANSIGFLVNPISDGAHVQIGAAEAAARILGVQLVVLNASTPSDIDAAFATLAERRGGALLVGADTFFANQSLQIIAWAVRVAAPVIYNFDVAVRLGGLMSYGPSLSAALRLAGTYAGRILKGEKPADLPVQQSTYIDMVLNLKTAKALGIEVPTATLLRATEVIE
jgi:putative tryptophan/tyrosine transport system substrate-binding protein